MPFFLWRICNEDDITYLGFVMKTTLHISVKYYNNGSQTDHDVQAQSQPKLSNIKYKNSLIKSLKLEFSNPYIFATSWCTHFDILNFDQIYAIKDQL